jgi:hypothetical protein
MEFSNVYANIKSEQQAAGWPAERHQKVNPFMQWAVASISGIYFGGAANAADHQPGRRFTHLPNKNLSEFPCNSWDRKKDSKLASLLFVC